MSGKAAIRWLYAQPVHETNTESPSRFARAYLLDNYETMHSTLLRRSTIALLSLIGFVSLALAGIANAETTSSAHHGSSGARAESVQSDTHTPEHATPGNAHGDNHDGIAHAAPGEHHDFANHDCGHDRFDHGHGDEHHVIYHGGPGYLGGHYIGGYYPPYAGYGHYIGVRPGYRYDHGIYHPIHGYVVHHVIDYSNRDTLVGTATDVDESSFVLLTGGQSFRVYVSNDSLAQEFVQDGDTVRVDGYRQAGIIDALTINDLSR